MFTYRKQHIFVTGLLLAVTAAVAQGYRTEEHVFATVAEYEEATGEQIANFNEAPMLQGMVEGGELPPVAERLPSEPLVLVPAYTIGNYGGTITAPSVGNSGYSDMTHARWGGILRINKEGNNSVAFIAKSCRDVRRAHR